MGSRSLRVKGQFLARGINGAVKCNVWGACVRKTSRRRGLFPNYFGQRCYFAALSSTTGPLNWGTTLTVVRMIDMLLELYTTNRQQLAAMEFEHYHCTPIAAAMFLNERSYDSSHLISFLARDVIYTSCAYATMSVSVCLWRKCIGHYS